MTRRQKHRELARQALTTLGGRAHVSTVRAAFVDLLDSEEARLLGLAQLDRYVAGLLRAVTSGDELPWALSTGDEFVQRPLLSLDERRQLIGRYMRQAGELRARAWVLAAETKQLFGVWIDPHAADEDVA